MRLAIDVKQITGHCNVLVGQHARRERQRSVTNFVRVTPEFAIGAQISAADIAQIREAGFAAIINARPDDEEGSYILSGEGRKIAEDQGLVYAHCPTENHAIFEPSAINRFELALAELPKPVLAHCKSGTRAAILWGLVAARHRPVEDVISTLRAAGQDIEFLENELRDSASIARGSPLRLKDDALLALGRSLLLGNSQRDTGRE